jgi:hypothetical protein
MVVLLVTLALTLPSVAMPHPCEVEVAKLKKDLDEIRGAVATIEAVPPSDMQRQMLAGAKGKYDLELRRWTEAQARCEGLVQGENPGAAPSPPSGGAPPVVPASAAASPEAPTTPGTPCLTGCGKDTDCKGDRICVKGACQDPPPR